MSVVILQKISKSQKLPSKYLFTKWVNKILSRYKKKYEIVIRLVSIKEIVFLNRKYRNKNQPTNIISFPFIPPKKIRTNLLGDIVICTSLVKKEAKFQHKSFQDHLAHLTIHGVLHLLGYNHETIKTANKMETIEIKCLKQLGINNPYL
ncbi:MAG: rRNA maturation RNase YbeY [Coxiellaceae bacterium]|jgi:probable rRNA maturation factor|nr:rRNA maturation RNase YbeY [Coxiellaceae bacterium]